MGRAATDTQTSPVPSPPLPEQRRSGFSALLSAPWHVLGFALLPTFWLYSENWWVMPSSALAGPMLFVVSALLPAFGAAWLLYRDPRAAGLAVSALAFLFGAYGFLAGELVHVTVGSVVLGYDRVMVPLWTGIALVVVLGAFRFRGRLSEATMILNAVALVLVVVNLAPSLVAQSQRAPLARGVHTADAPFRAAVENPWRGPPRDIYYLVFDRYGGSETLIEEYGHDNTPFLRSLEERGFDVAHDSIANYPKTSLSLASSLNMNYLDEMAEALPEGFRDRAPVIELLQDHRLARLLKERGYRYEHLGSWWDSTSKATLADVNHRYNWTGEFARKLLEFSAANPVADHLGWFRDQVDSRRIVWKQTKRQLDRIHTAGRSDDAPTFVFAHVLLPHDPYAFDEDGNYQPEDVQKGRHLWVKYREQLTYTNKRIDALLDDLLAGPVEEHPIIVLSADEGPHPVRQIADASIFWAQARDDELAVKLRILHAVYFPGVRVSIPEDTSAVNTFRFLFNAYTDAELPLLPDRAFVYPSSERFYEFEEVTDRLRGAS